VLPDGSVRPFPIPTKDAVQHRIIIGPDGSLWFTELKADKIGHMVNGHESGPPIDGVYSQAFHAEEGAVAYRALFEQGSATYDARFEQEVIGQSDAAGLREAFIDFDANLQGDVNRLSGNATTYGFKVPPVEGRNIRTRFGFTGNRVFFTQTQRIDGTIYASSVSVSIGQAQNPSATPTSLSSATAHYLEAIKVLTGQTGPI
jgi:hypothetical protein